jgi:hypothetical protein
MGGSLIHDDLQNDKLGSVSSSTREKIKLSFAPGVHEMERRVS